MNKLWFATLLGFHLGFLPSRHLAIEGWSALAEIIVASHYKIGPSF
jgi:hypothetical protein